MNQSTSIPVSGRNVFITGANTGIGRVTARELARRLQGTGVSTYSLHPGVVATDVWRHVPWLLKPLLRFVGMITPDEGAKTTLHCATSAALARETGLYYDRCKPRTPSALGQDAALAAELWRRSETFTR